MNTIFFENNYIYEIFYNYENFFKREFTIKDICKIQYNKNQKGFYQIEFFNNIILIKNLETEYIKTNNVLNLTNNQKNYIKKLVKNGFCEKFLHYLKKLLIKNNFNKL